MQRTRTRTVVPPRFHRRAPLQFTGELAFEDGIYANPSPRYFRDGIDNAYYGPFAANVIAQAQVSGRTYALFETAEAQQCLETQDLDDTVGGWTWNRLFNVAPDTIADPAGNLTADTVIPNNTVGGHYLNQNFSWTLGHYTEYCFARPKEYDKIRLSLPAAAFVGNPWSEFDVTLGTNYANNSGAIGVIVDVGNGWYFIASSAVCDTATSSVADWYVLDEAGALSYAGDNSKGIYMWGCGITKSYFARSYVERHSAPVTKQADSFRYPAAVVPSTFYRGNWHCIYIPYANSVQAQAGGVRTICMVDDGTTNHRIDMVNQGANRAFYLYESGILRVATGEIAWDDHSQVQIGLGSSSGRMIITGATSGDGTYYGTAWQWPEGNDFWYGMTRTATQQVDGQLSRPRGGID